MGKRIGEQRVVRKIRPACDHVHGEPGHLELFLARSVKLPELGDRGHLAQQPHIVEATLVHASGRPLSLRGPADLALYLCDKLRDALCGGIGLLALQPRQHGLIFAIGECDFDAGVHQQRRATSPMNRTGICGITHRVRACFRTVAAARPPQQSGN